MNSSFRCRLHRLLSGVCAVIGISIGLASGSPGYAGSDAGSYGGSPAQADAAGTEPDVATTAVTGTVTGAVTGQTPAERVQAMSVALKALNYEGTFVHVRGSHVTAMHILHASTPDGELERLRALDGEAREVIRNRSLVTCIWPDSQSVVVSKSRPRELLPRLTSELAGNQRYTFTFDEPDRVAGLPTDVVNVEPDDGYRYGYRFWIHTETGMLLRSMLVDAMKRPLEQVMFTQIEYPLHIDPARFDVMQDAEQVSWLEPKKAMATSGLPESPDEQADRVDFTSLPAGYREVSETLTSMPLDDNPISHVMLTDGMASVSVYVEYLPASQQDHSLAGLSSMGAMNAYGLSTNAAFITAVGDVPGETVQAIASAVVIN